MRRLVVALLLSATAWAAPSPALATLPQSGADAGRSGLAEEKARLNDLRERLLRRKALQRSLDGRLEQLARRDEELRLERARVGRALQEVRDDARALEIRMDRLVPRLLARAETAEARRSHAARALADIAGVARHVELDPTLKARLLAVTPSVLERLRGADRGLARLREAREAVIARHGEVRRAIPLLVAEEQGIERDRRRLRQQHAAVRARQREVEREVADLERRQVELARRIRIAGDARRARAELRAGGRAWSRRLLPVPDAAPTMAKDSAGRPDLPGRSVGSMQATLPRVLGAAPPSRLPPGPRVASSRPAKPALPVKADLQRRLSQASRSSLTRTAALDLDELQPGVTLPGSRRPDAIGPSPRGPIMPIQGPVLNGFGEGDDAVGERSLVLAAAPGQAVAAPDDGRVVFAGTFMSYGPLLIIEHDPEYHVLLWGLSRLDVNLGDRVRAGQIVGVMEAGGEHVPHLHVELRRNGRPVNPLSWLAASSSKARG